MQTELLVIGGLLFALYLAVRRDIHGIKPKKRNKKAEPKKKSKAGYVYILSNPSYRPGIFKIGLTTRAVGTRANELDTTGVPTPFVVCAKIKTHDCHDLEKMLHQKYASNRVRDRREFFKLTKSQIEYIIGGMRAFRDTSVEEYHPNAVRDALRTS